MSITFIPLEKLVVGCNHRGKRHLRHTIYYRTGDGNILPLEEAFKPLDDAVWDVIRPLLKQGRIYATEGDYNKFYHDERHLDR